LPIKAANKQAQQHYCTTQTSTRTSLVSCSRKDLILLNNATILENAYNGIDWLAYFVQPSSVAFANMKKNCIDDALRRTFLKGILAESSMDVSRQTASENVVAQRKIKRQSFAVKHCCAAMWN